MKTEQRTTRFRIETDGAVPEGRGGNLHATGDAVAEIVSNARRAGARNVAVHVSSRTGTVEVDDDGHGVTDWKALFTTGVSGWLEKIRQDEQPAGIGLLTLRTSRQVTIVSKVDGGPALAAVVEPKHWRGETDVEVRQARRDETSGIDGPSWTRVRWFGGVDVSEAESGHTERWWKRLAETAGPAIHVTVDGERKRHWSGDHVHGENHGDARIEVFTEAVNQPKRGRAGLYLRGQAIDTGHVWPELAFNGRRYYPTCTVTGNGVVRLTATLPRAGYAVQDKGGSRLNELTGAAALALYRAVARMPAETETPKQIWSEALRHGVQVPVPPRRLRPWPPANRPAWAGGASRREAVEGEAVLIDPERHGGAMLRNLDGALRTARERDYGDARRLRFYETDAELDYEWQAEMQRVSGIAVVVRGARGEQRYGEPPGGTTPAGDEAVDTIEVEVRIVDRGIERTHYWPARYAVLPVNGAGRTNPDEKETAILTTAGTDPADVAKTVAAVCAPAPPAEEARCDGGQIVIDHVRRRADDGALSRRIAARLGNARHAAAAA